MHLPKLIVSALIVIAVPAGAQRFLSGPTPRCFAADRVIYRLAADAHDIGTAVRVTGSNSAADMILRVVDSPELADFILVDDPENTGAAACRRQSVLATRTIRVNPASAAFDLTVALSQPETGTKADYQIYVRTGTFSLEEAAALFAVMARSAELHAMTRR